MKRFSLLLMIGAVAGAAVLATTTRGAPSKKAGSGADQAQAEAERGEWSRWRGPNNDGMSYEKGLLKAWPKEGPPVVWKTSGLGGGFSSVSIAGGHLFTLGDKDGACKLFCRDIKDGSEVWSTEVGGGGGPNCTPTVDGDHVYTVSKGGDLSCVKIADGSLVWQKNFERDFGGKMMSGWGYSESPLVDGNLLLCTPGGNDALLAALDKTTGETIWQTKVDQDLGKRGGDGAGYASIVISNAAKTKQYVTLVGRGMVGVDAADGKLLWHYGGVANGTANIPTPVIAGDFVFCSSGYSDGGTALLKIGRKGKVLAAEEVYQFPANEMQNHHGGMIRIGEYVYMGHGHNNGFPMCVHVPTGKVAWKPGRGPGSESAAVAYADGHLYFRYQDGTMALIEANPKKYVLKSSFKSPTHNGEHWPHPVIAGGKLYLRDQDELVCFDVKAK